MRSSWEDRVGAEGLDCLSEALGTLCKPAPTGSSKWLSMVEDLLSMGKRPSRALRMEDMT